MIYYARPKIVGVIFDVDGTLVDSKTASREALELTFRELRDRYPWVKGDYSVQELLTLRRQVDQELRERPLDLTELRLEIFKRLLMRLRVNVKNALGFNNLYLDYRKGREKFFPEVEEVLDNLPSGLALGIISGGDGLREEMGLSTRFLFQLLAKERGVGKEGPELFRMALELVRCEGHQLVHVGDSLRHDVFSAQMAGFWTVWVNRNHEPNETDIDPDFTIPDLKGLPEIVERLDRGIGNLYK